MSTPQPSAQARQPKRVVVRAPATSANLGPGFDCLGLALNLWNEVAAEVTCTGVLGETAVTDLSPGGDLVLAGIAEVFRVAGAPLVPLRLTSRVNIPVGRGLGSSAAALASGVLLANTILGDPLDEEHLIQIASLLEGHPDNVVPALLGGVQTSGVGSYGRILHARIKLGAELRTVVFVPDASLPTSEARAVLPELVPFSDALFNLGRTGLLVAALASGDTALLAEGMQDRLHQTYREPLFPAGRRLIEAAIEAGALGASISGAGPSVLALCSDDATSTRVERALVKAATEEGVSGHARPLTISSRGAHVIERQ